MGLRYSVGVPYVTEGPFDPTDSRVGHPDEHLHRATAVSGDQMQGRTADRRPQAGSDELQVLGAALTVVW